jgi:hypothetical protein
MTLDLGLACLLFAVALLAAIASTRALLGRKPTRMLRGLPLNRRRIWAVATLLVEAGCLMQGVAELGQASLLGFADSLLLLAGVSLSRAVRRRPAL